jgi:integration host factor subunit beta
MQAGHTFPDPQGRDIQGAAMATITKKDLIDQISAATGETRVTVKKVVQAFLDSIVIELGRGNRLEFRDFGVFEIKNRAARIAQNPKTLQRVPVPPKKTVKFKVGRMMKQALTASGDGQSTDGETQPKVAGPGARPAADVFKSQAASLD